ncbi:MAG: S8/S53 family peptidase [Solirubrobacteraceae bacterium]
MLRTLGAVAIMAAAPSGVLATTARAESPQTPESVAYGLDWIARVPDAQFGPVATRPAICLVDTGVAITPDTPATSDAGPIIARLNVYQDDPIGGDPNAMLHGTRMAATIAAPRNNWGIVGIWPGARIVSVKASEDGTFDSAAVLRGITMCRQWSIQTGIPLSVVNLSLGSSGADPAYVTRWTEYTARVNGDGASVVAAAGNDPSQGTQWPAAAPGAIAVAAGTPDASAFCSFASHDALTKVVAPGCNVTAADANGEEASWPDGGSSDATAATSAVLGALRALRPDADHTTAENWLTAGGTLLDSARTLNGVAIANAAGLGGLVTSTPVQAPVFPTSTPPAPLAAPTSLRAKLTGSSRKRKLRVLASGAPTGARLQVAVRSGGHWRRASGSTSATVATIHALPSQLWARWARTDGTTSTWSAMKRPKSHASARVWHTVKPHGPKPPQG